MASIETTPDVGEKVEAAPAEAAELEGWKASAIVSDVVTLGGGTALAAVFNMVLVFLIPRLISVKEYGYWRLFLLYAGYVGFLHFGFADGALLRWVGKSEEEIARESGATVKFLFWEQLPLVVVVVGLSAMLLPNPLDFIGAGIGALALGMNLSALLQYGTQAARVFNPVAIATAMAPGAFMAFVLLGSLRASLTAPELIALYVTAWGLVLGYLWTQVRPQFGATGNSAWELGKVCIATGWPVVLANTGLGLVQTADRLVVSSVLPITDFAQYSLAASAMFVPVTAIAAISRVFLSHAAAVEHGNRARIYGHASRFLLVAWSLLLPYFFVLEAFVKRFLPRYIVALPVAGVLVLSVIFLAGIQILHMTYFYLYGKQRQFLYRTVIALAFSFALALILLKTFHSLVAVATGQVAALAIWWMLNEWSLRKTSSQGMKDWGRTLAVCIWSAASYALALWGTKNIGLRILLYYSVAAVLLWLFFADEFRLVRGALIPPRLT